MVAYQPGNAANVPATATMSQTSLPSHTGAIVEMTERRPGSSLPTAPCSMPTPKSNPARTKKPTHSTARARNQKATRVMGPFLGRTRHSGARRSVGRRQLRLLLLAGPRRGVVGELPAGEARHQPPADDGENAVDRDEGDQAHDDGTRADR